MDASTIRKLGETDRRMARLMEHVGKCRLKPERKRSPFESLVRAIAHQQLTGRVAEVILGRFIGLFGPGEAAFPQPEEVLKLSVEKLRSAGFSQAKALAILDLAEKTRSGLVPGTEEIELLTDEDIIERLVQIRGVGRWTVEMLLIFQLGRRDVMPIDDFGVRKGFGVVYRKGAMPTRGELKEYAERWRPHRTTAAWYLWRAVELGKWPPPRGSRD